MLRTNFFDDSDDDDDVAPPATAPRVVPGPPSPIATATAGPSLAEVLASVHPSLAAELHEVARSIAQDLATPGDNHMDDEVRQGDEDVPIGTHTSAPPAPAASSSSSATVDENCTFPASQQPARSTTSALPSFFSILHSRPTWTCQLVCRECRGPVTAVPPATCTNTRVETPNKMINVRVRPGPPHPRTQSHRYDL